MPTRASVFETLQVGVETTAGTAVPATKRLQAFELDCDPQTPNEPVESMGWKAPVDIILSKPWTKATMKGKFAFNDALYLFSSGLCTGVVTTPAGNGAFTVALGTPSAGTFTLTFNAVTTAGIAFNAASTAVQTALTGLSTVGVGNATVTGANGGPYTVTFTGALASTALALTGSGASLTGGTFLITAGAAATNTRRWTFTPTMTGPDTYKTFTIEKGSSVNGSKFAFGAVSDLSLEWGIKEIAIKGELIGGVFQDGITMTPTPTDVPIYAASPKNTSVYIGTSLLGMTQLRVGAADCFKVTWGFKNRFAPVFDIDASQQTMSSIVEDKMGFDAQIAVEQDSAADAYMTGLLAGTTYFCRVITTGSLIEAGYNRRCQVTFPFKFQKSARGDMEKVYTGTYDLMPFYSSTFGGAVEVVVDVDYTAL